jgi:hypothetical protein
MSAPRCSCGESFATAEELFDHVESHDTATAKGRCPVCRRYVTVEVAINETSFIEAASRHDPTCASAFLETVKQAREYLDRRQADGRPLDLWNP